MLSRLWMQSGWQVSSQHTQTDIFFNSALVEQIVDAEWVTGQLSTYIFSDMEGAPSTRLPTVLLVNRSSASASEVCFPACPCIFLHHRVWKFFSVILHFVLFFSGRKLRVSSIVFCCCSCLIFVAEPVGQFQLFRECQMFGMVFWTFAMV